MGNKPFKNYQESKLSLYFFHTFICLLVTQSPPKSGNTKITFHWLWGCCCLRVPTVMFGNESKGRSNRRGGSCRMGRKRGGHAHPHPHTLWNRARHLSRQDFPLPRRSSRELKAALGGKGAGVKAALIAQSEKKSMPLCIHSASLTSWLQSQHWQHVHCHVQTHKALGTACLVDSPQQGPSNLACARRLSQAAQLAYPVALMATLRAVCWQWPSS